MLNGKANCDLTFLYPTPSSQSRPCCTKIFLLTFAAGFSGGSDVSSRATRSFVKPSNTFFGTYTLSSVFTGPAGCRAV